MRGDDDDETEKNPRTHGVMILEFKYDYNSFNWISNKDLSFALLDGGIHVLVEGLKGAILF